MNKETRKLYRLQTAEQYKIHKASSTRFEVMTKNAVLKAFVSTMGVIVFAKSGDSYSKIELYKLQNLCNLLQKCCLGM